MLTKEQRDELRAMISASSKYVKVDLPTYIALIKDSETKDPGPLKSLKDLEKELAVEEGDAYAIRSVAPCKDQLTRMLDLLDKKEKQVAPSVQPDPSADPASSV